MTEGKTSISQLRSTFLKLNNLAGRQKDETEANLNRAKQVLNSTQSGILKYSKQEMLLTEETDSYSHGSDNSEAPVRRE